MSVIYYHRCDRYVDTDFHAAVTIDDEEMCEDCASDEELYALDPEHYDPPEGETCSTCQGSGMSSYGPPDEGRCASCGGRGSMPSAHELAARERAEAMQEDDKMGER